MLDLLYPYEEQMVKADLENVEIYEVKMSGSAKGLYCDNVIYIEKYLSNAEKNCILAEEMGHHHTTSGNIINQSIQENRIQERKARADVYKHILPLERLVKAYENGCQNRFEAAEYLNVTEQFFLDCINYYYSHYGNYIEYGDYMIHLNRDTIYVQKMD